MNPINIDQDGRYAVIRVSTGVVAVVTDSNATAQMVARDHGGASIVIDLITNRVCDVYDGGSQVKLGIDGIQHLDND
jgi:hypothetical protein